MDEFYQYERNKTITCFLRKIRAKGEREVI